MSYGNLYYLFSIITITLIEFTAPFCNLFNYEAGSLVSHYKSNKNDKKYQNLNKLA